MDTNMSGGASGKESACQCEDIDSIPGWKDFLEKEMANHSSILAWRIPMNREAWQAIVRGCHKEPDTTVHTYLCLRHGC